MRRRFLVPEMPGSNHGPSILNPKVYEALRRKGMSKRRAAMISNAQRHKDSGIADLAIPPHGPDALFNQPGIAQRRRRKRYKTFNWGAHVGQAISGRLIRGEGGRFAGDGQATAVKPPSKSRERRTALRAARQQRMDAMRAARVQEQADENAKRTEEDAYIAAGKSGRERQKRRAEVAAARRDRANARRAAHQKQIEDERATRTEEDAAPADEEAAGAEPKKGGGGGGGGKKKPSEEEKRAAQDEKKAQQRAAAAPKAGLSTDEADWLAGVASGTAPAGSFDGRHLAELGLTQDAGDTTEVTDAGRRLLNALERGDVRGALAAIQDGKAKLARDRARVEQRRRRDAAKQARIAQQRQKRPRQTTKAQATFGGQPRAALTDSVFAGPDRSFPIKTAQDVRDAVRSLGRTKHDKAAVKRGIIRRARAIGAAAALPESWREKAQSDQEKAMFANMGGGKGGGGGGSKGGGGGAAKEPTLWNKNPQTGKREPSMGLVHENLFGASYTKRQQELQAAGGIEAMLNKPKKGREQFFQEQTAAVSHQTPLPKITTAKPAPTASAAHGLSKPERYHELEGLTERTKMPQAGWNAPMSDKQGGYLGSLLDRAKLNTKEGGETRQLANDLIAAAKAGKLTKWEASKLIDTMQRPKPFSTLLEQARGGVRDGNSEAPWRALLAIPSFRTALINHTLNREADEEGLPF